MQHNLADLLTSLTPGREIAGAREVAFSKVCVDSRRATEGSLFVALKGEHSDGLDYAPDALRRGATVVLVERPVEGAMTIEPNAESLPDAVRAPVAVVVSDPLAALQRYASAYRAARADLAVTGVTGSLGKTTTKETVAAVLGQRFTTLRSPGNYNNEIGLPLALLELEPEHTRAVLEMAMYDVGEIADLCDIARPRVGIVTNVLPIHLERLGSIERIAEAKAELVRALPADGTAILNGDDPRVCAMRELSAAEVVTFGRGPDNDVWASEVRSCGMAGVAFTVKVRQRGLLGDAPAKAELHVSMLGQHVVMTALAGVAAGLLEGLTWDEIQAGLLAQGRGVRLVPKQGVGGVVLLDDSYNASPSSMLAALDSLAGLPGRRVAALGDMLELGAQEEEGHRLVGRRCAEVVDLLVAVGQRGQLIAQEALQCGMRSLAVYTTADSRGAVSILRQVLQAGDNLLVKGSRSMGMEAIIQALEETVA